MASCQARSRPRAAGTRVVVPFACWHAPLVALQCGTIVANPRRRRVARVASFRCVGSSSSSPSPCWRQLGTREPRESECRRKPPRLKFSSVSTFSTSSSSFPWTIIREAALGDEPMSTLLPDNFETVSPTDSDARLALESSRILASRKLGKKTSVRIRLGDDDSSEGVVVPTSAVRLFLHLLVEMSQGHAVTLIPTHAELTTQQAADLLNVSRPYVVKLLDEGKIPSRLVGKYRRVRFDDLMAFKKKDDQARSEVLDQLAQEAQELGLGY